MHRRQDIHDCEASSTGIFRPTHSTEGRCLCTSKWILRAKRPCSWNCQSWGSKSNIWKAWKCNSYVPLCSIHWVVVVASHRNEAKKIRVWHCSLTFNLITMDKRLKGKNALFLCLRRISQQNKITKKATKSIYLLTNWVRGYSCISSHSHREHGNKKTQKSKRSFRKLPWKTFCYPI